MRVPSNTTSLRRKTLRRRPRACQEIVRISCALVVINWQLVTIGWLDYTSFPSAPKIVRTFAKLPGDLRSNAEASYKPVCARRNGKASTESSVK